jgi:hypothetical protein
VQTSPQAAIEWQSIRLTGQDALAVRASKKLRTGDLLVVSLAGSLLRMELDRVPLWRGDHVAVKQLIEDFGRYLYLPRLRDSSVLLEAIRDGVALLTWPQDSFAYADAFDESASRYTGLMCGKEIPVSEDSSGLLVRSEVARRQLAAETPPPTGPTTTGPDTGTGPGGAGGGATTQPGGTTEPQPPPAPRRFHGSVSLDPTRVGRDASRIADEVIAHLSGLVGASVNVTLEIEARIPSGAPEIVVRVVTENSRTLKFTSHGFEEE